MFYIVIVFTVISQVESVWWSTHRRLFAWGPNWTWKDSPFRSRAHPWTRRSCSWHRSSRHLSSLWRSCFQVHICACFNGPFQRDTYLHQVQHRPGFSWKRSGFPWMSCSAPIDGHYRILFAMFADSQWSSILQKAIGTLSEMIYRFSSSKKPWNFPTLSMLSNLSLVMRFRKDKVPIIIFGISLAFNQSVCVCVHLIQHPSLCCF